MPSMSTLWCIMSVFVPFCVCLLYWYNTRGIVHEYKYLTPGARSRRTCASVSFLAPAYISIRQHTAAYVSIRQHTPAFVSIRQHTSAYVSIRQHTSAYVSIRQHTPAYACIRQHTSIRYRRTCASVSCLVPAYVSICQHPTAYVSIRQHTSAYVALALQYLAGLMHLYLALPG